jgi:K+-sensing histidine kinase KdpD
MESNPQAFAEGVDGMRDTARTLVFTAELLMQQAERMPSGTDDAGIRRLAAQNQQLAVQLHAQMENVLSASGIEGSSRPLERQRLRLTDVLQDVAPVAQTLLRGRGQRLETEDDAGDEADEEAQDVIVDPLRLAQALLNLIVDAGARSAAGATIRVHVAGHAIVAWSEEWRGPTVPDVTNLPIAKGIQLGMLVAASIMTAHGGEIRTETTTDGHTVMSLIFQEAPQTSAPLP